MSSYALERSVAISAVIKASLLSQQVQKELIKEDDSLTKKDNSPVTVADYTSQALITLLLSAHFPADAIIGEEDSSDLLLPKNDVVRTNIIRLANESMSASLEQDHESEKLWTTLKEDGTRGQKSQKEWLEIIDRGCSEGGASGRHWAIDPIDGTKGFLRGGQYAVCLGLIRDGQVVVGVMGCPNLLVDHNGAQDGERGVIFVAVKGEGAYQRSLSSPTLTRINMSAMTPDTLSDATFCESVEAGHSDHSTNSKIATLLGITKQSVRMDSQAKYCSIGRGDGQIYLRLPVSETYEEKVWDHSSGSLLVTEAGGIVSDMNGLPLDFAAGRTLKNNKGVVACHAAIHARVIEAVKEAVKESGSKALM